MLALIVSFVPGAGPCGPSTPIGFIMMVVGLLALPIGAVMFIIGLLIGFFDEYPARHV
jgi:hypothetical protein